MSLCVEIQKRLGNFQLDVQFEAHQEPLALLGASGCSKSVTLRCIAGILTPDTGKSFWMAPSSTTARPTSTCLPSAGTWAISSKQYALFPT